MPRRAHNVQVPGQTADHTTTDESQPTPTTTDAPPAGLADEQPKAAAPKAAKAAAPVSYRDMPAKDIDPAKLSAPVLSRDGWVVPLPKTKGA